MSLLFSEYLSPTNPIASGIVTFLQVIFFFWFAGLVAYGLWLLAKWRQINKNENVQLLVNVRREQNRGLEESEQKARAEEGFREFCKKQTLAESSSIAKHLKAIFFAGWEESRLEVSELIKHTTSNLFKWNSLLRSVLAVFIVIGLLGTLFGLTDSLTQLTPTLEASATDETSAENSEKMTQALSVLLNEMKGAFAPSILGIIFTVFGVIIYNVHLQLVCHPVESILERLTLTIWVPQLYPTTSQKLIQTLQQSEQQMRSGYQTATQVGKLVETVQSNISDFNKNLNRANAITQPLSDSVLQINVAADGLRKFSQEFSENVTRLTGFQDEIRNLHQQFQKGADQKLDEQNQNLVKTLNALKNYEDRYITVRQQTDEILENFISEATEANTSINTTNRELIGEIQDQLTTDLNKLNDQLSSLDAPIKGAADQIRGTFQNFVQHIRSTMSDLQMEIKTQNQNYANQLEAVLNLNQGILALLENLDKNSENQGAEVSKLSTAVNSLTGNINGLTTAIESFTLNSGTLGKSIRATESGRTDKKKISLFLKRIWNSLLRKKGS